MATKAEIKSRTKYRQICCFCWIIVFWYWNIELGGTKMDDLPAPSWERICFLATGVLYGFFTLGLILSLASSMDEVALGRIEKLEEELAKLKESQ